MTALSAGASLSRAHSRYPTIILGLLSTIRKNVCFWGTNHHFTQKESRHSFVRIAIVWSASVSKNDGTKVLLFYRST